MVVLSRNELNEKYGIQKNTWNRRKEDLLAHLGEYMEIKEIEECGRYSYEIEGMPDKIPPLPRKGDTERKQKKYEEFTLKSLGKKWKANSRAKVSRDAIAAFGYKEFGHESEAAVNRRYVGPVFKEKGERSSAMVWVNGTTYEEMNDEELMGFYDWLDKVNIDVEFMEDTFFRVMQEESVDDARGRYLRAVNEFKKEFGYRPIKVYRWRIKRI